MSHGYRFVGWNRQKKLYDLTLWGGILLFLLAYIGGSLAFQPDAANNVEMLLLRGFALAAFILLHIILSIGPLARLNRRFLPLLYNRRHMGVSMFILAFLHGALALVIYHSQGDLNPLVSMLAGNTEIGSLSSFPFQPLGFAALLILFLMAATSHDFWMANLTPPVWKALHMMVYVAYALLIAHVSLGYLQAETGLLPALLTGIGFVWIFGLHLSTATIACKYDRPFSGDPDEQGWVCAGPASEIPEKRGKIIVLSGERVAVFRYDGKVSAISNVCQHQNGPLGEGWILDGFVTCPWHGFQYDPATGASPPPFTEKVPTFNVRITEGQIFVNPKPNPAGTRVEPALLRGGES
jgi:nitrite reductase/ring-hydroxylating ferredoxin subunit/DMSO/TMAO reductase YedYZ heme-binding membrane subunit